MLVPVPAALARPVDATLSVTKAARVLGVHPNTVRAWSDGGRLRYYRINARGDRRYRLGDLQRFLSAARVESPDETTVLASATRPGRIAPPIALWARDGADSAVPLLARLAELTARAAAPGADLDSLLRQTARIVRTAGDHRLVIIREQREANHLTRASDGADTVPDGMPPASIPGVAEDGAADLLNQAERAVALPASRPRRRQVSGMIPGEHGPWGSLVVVRDDQMPATRQTRASERAVVHACARAIGSIIRAAGTAAATTRQLGHSEALRRMAADLGSRQSVDEVLAGLVDHTVRLLDADAVGVVLRGPVGSELVEASRGLDATALESLRTLAPGSLAAVAVAAGRPVAGQVARDAPRPGDAPAARSGVGNLSPDRPAWSWLVPLLDGGELLGVLEARGRAGGGTGQELAAVTALAEQASVAIRTAQNHERMLTWAAQLQSIQQLGVRLNGLRTVGEIGQAIATELRQLIDYHNVRVYRLYGSSLVPVAMQGSIGEYHDETPDQLGLVLGQGLTGWVAEHGIPLRVGNAAADPRAWTIPGTDKDLEESMLLAPMGFEGEVLGVLVLAKLGLHQFRDDHLRLLVIYASFAAQAMANADATEQLNEKSAALERQLKSQRELVAISESILQTLDTSSVLQQIADGLEVLVGYETASIEGVDPASGLLVALIARGPGADRRLKPWQAGEAGLARWAVDNNMPALVLDAGDDPRIDPGRDRGEPGASRIAVPLRGRRGALGVLSLERARDGSPYTTDELELVQLFGAQVSIALQNAEAHRVVQIQARTDDLTGLLNHGTFMDRLAEAVRLAGTFSLLMLDLDGFKRVNDALGHQAGDALLVAIAAALVASVREEDQVFRYGGDEFAILLSGTDAGGAAAAAERVSNALRAVGSVGSRWQAEGIDVAASIGVATFPDDGTAAAAVLLAADRACFVAKRTGRGRIATAREGLALAGELSLQAPTPVDRRDIPGS
jgi:diguanylate cyclase (GGDEF)-like protein/excisionase family DNA binding protein